ncbi:hypothetical protein ACIVBQ_002030 [Tenacibaculum discolor]
MSKAEREKRIAKHENINQLIKFFYTKCSKKVMTLCFG